jgi:phosphatidate cytidylyltransferase
MADVHPLEPAGTGGPVDAPAGRPSRAGRNLPAAVAVGVGLLGVLAASLWFRPEPFVVLVVVVVGAALWELKQAFARRSIRLPLVPLVVGAAGMQVSAYTSGAEALLIAYFLTIGAVVVWRVLDGPGPSALRDAAASVFATTYVPLLAGFVVMLLNQPDGELRVALFVLLAVANDTGGYAAGVLFGRHPLAPTVSPKKSWEGLGGSVALTVLVGVLGCVLALGLSPLLGVALGVLTAVTATVGDLAESLVKRDLELKDMGSLLPGHGGVLDRIDSLVITAPFVYLVLSVAA